MAEFCYANTTHPTFFTKVNTANDGTKPTEVEVDGSKWIKFPCKTSANIITPAMKDVYISFEIYAPVPIKVYNYAPHPYVSVFYGDEAPDSEMLIVNCSWQDSYFHFHNGDRRDFNRGSSYKILVHLKNFNDRDVADITTSATKFNTEDWGRASTYRGLHIGCYMQNISDTSIVPDADWALYVRNIIVSSTPISIADQIKEVDVKSIVGDGWFSSGGKSFTNRIDQSATITLDKDQMDSILERYTVKKFIYSATIDREGDKIQNVYLSRGGDLVTLPLDVGEHYIGCSWDATQTNPNTLTIESKGGNA